MRKPSLGVHTAQRAGHRVVTLEPAPEAASIGTFQRKSVRRKSATVGVDHRLAAAVLGQRTWCHATGGEQVGEEPAPVLLVVVAEAPRCGRRPCLGHGATTLTIVEIAQR